MKLETTQEYLDSFEAIVDHSQRASSDDVHTQLLAMAVALLIDIRGILLGEHEKAQPPASATPPKVKY